MILTDRKPAWRVEYRSRNRRGERIWIPGFVLPAGQYDSAEQAIAAYQRHLQNTVLAARASTELRAKPFHPKV